MLLLILLLQLLLLRPAASDDSSGSSSIAAFSRREVVAGVGERQRLELRLQIGAGGQCCLHIVQRQPVIAVEPAAPAAPAASDVCADANSSQPLQFDVVGLRAGRSLLGVNCSDAAAPAATVSVRVVRSSAVQLLNWTAGLLYLLCWSVSFYPQTVLNCRRRSVVGLSFDFVGLNFLGFVAYSIFNVGMYCVPAVRSLYSAAHPDSVMPVQLADVVFAVHAAAVTGAQAVQCAVYERGRQQQVSLAGRVLLGSLLLVLVGGFCAACGLGGAWWLQYLFLVSYVKLAATLTKYSPQVYANCQRRSTFGWSVLQVFFDFFGGVFSTAQLLLLAYNYDDWYSLLGDATKLGLGVSSMLYDAVFFLQHYWLYGPSLGGTLSLDNSELTASGETAKLLDSGKR